MNELRKNFAFRTKSLLSSLAEEKFWDKPNPKKSHHHLTPAQKKQAKARAKSAGRPYPNLVDNAAVAKKHESKYRPARVSTRSKLAAMADAGQEDLVQGVASGRYRLGPAHQGVKVPTFQPGDMYCDSCCISYTPTMPIHKKSCPKCGCTDVFEK